MDLQVWTKALGPAEPPAFFTARNIMFAKPVCLQDPAHRPAPGVVSARMSFILGRSSRSRLSIGVVMAVAVLAGAAEAQGKRSFPEQDAARIREASAEFAKAVIARDLKALVSQYTNDGVLYPPGETMVKGHAAIEACLAALPPMRDFVLRVLSVEGQGDLAYVQGTYTLVTAPPGAAEPVQDSGYFLEVLRRQPDGRWLIAVQMFTPH
jgi:ketosteroid isomerase-like protein